MKRFVISRLLAGTLCLSLLMPARADIVATAVVSDQPPAVEVKPGEELKPKFFLFGFLLNVALKFAVASFQEWYKQQLTVEVAEPINYMRLLRNSALSSLASSAGSALFPALSFKSASAVDRTPAVATDDAERRISNFQGAHVAVVGFDGQGQVTGLRPLQTSFRSGERIKLKVISSFDAWFVIENVSPNGVRQQIYPRDASQAVLLRAGNEILVPLVEDQFLEFTGETGRDQLVLTFRDPGGRSGPLSNAAVVMQEEANGVGLLQEVPPGAFPLISQALTFNHVPAVSAPGLRTVRTAPRTPDANRP
ncbi:MAG: DUF4384 domain-containing protein [Curvibacter sp.]